MISIPLMNPFALALTLLAAWAVLATFSWAASWSRRRLLVRRVGAQLRHTEATRGRTEAMAR